MEMLMAGLVLFLGMHGLSRMRGLREALVTRLGANGFKGLYSLVSLAGLVVMTIGYGAYRSAGMIPLWNPPDWTRHIAFLLMLPVFPLLVAGNAPMGKIKASVVHPMLLAVKLWAISHLIANGDLGSILLFGGFLAWALIARIALGKAERTTVPWSGGDWIALGAGIALYAVTLVWAHGALIGVALAG
jgi:uncharacterized membrane protein